MSWRRCVLVACLLTACAGSEAEVDRYENASQGYSVSKPSGWEISQERGHAVLSPKPAQPSSKHTIVIRSAPKPTEVREGTPATQSDIVGATARALRGLPRSKIGEPVKYPGTEMSAIRFSVQFVPRGLASTYRREHVLLIGAKHLFHVIYTAPANESVDEASLRHVVTTLNEES